MNRSLSSHALKLSLSVKCILAGALPALLCVAMWSYSLNLAAAVSSWVPCAGLIAALALGAAAGAYLFESISRRLRELTESISVVSSGMPIRPFDFSDDELGQLSTAIVHMSREVTGQKAQLREVGSRLEAVLRATTEVCILGEDSGGKIIFCNPGAERMLGYREPELIGRSLLDTVHPAPEMRNPQLADALRAARRDALSTAQEHENAFIARDGRCIDVQLSMAPIKDGKAQTTGLLYVAHDITPRKTLELELRQKNELLKRQTETQSEVAKRTTDSLGRLNTAVLPQLLSADRKLSAIKLVTTEAEYFRSIEDIRPLLERAIDALRMATQDGASFSPDTPEEGFALPVLVATTPDALPGGTYAMQEQIERWYEHNGDIPASHAPKERRGRILVVDDFDASRALLNAYLKDLGYDLDFAADGQEALTKISEQAYTLVLMDVEMPRMDGHETVRRIRLWEIEVGRPALPVIAISAQGLDPKQAQEGGWTASVEKPVSKLQLVSELKKHLPIRSGR